MSFVVEQGPGLSYSCITNKYLCTYKALDVDAAEICYSHNELRVLISLVISVKKYKTKHFTETKPTVQYEPPIRHVAYYTNAILSN